MHYSKAINDEGLREAEGKKGKTRKRRRRLGKPKRCIKHLYDCPIGLKIAHLPFSSQLPDSLLRFNMWTGLFLESLLRLLL